MRFIVWIICIVSSPVWAIRFDANTEILNAQTPKACERAGGKLVQWYDEVYCIRKNNWQVLVGRTLTEAQALFPERRVRAVSENGQALMVTRDYVVGRINVSLRNGVIDGFYVEGYENEQLPAMNAYGGRLSRCELYWPHEKYQGPCFFAPYKGNGGFAIYPPDGSDFFGKLNVISLWKISTAEANLMVRRGSILEAWGAVYRSDQDRACWVSTQMVQGAPSFAVCVYAWDHHR